VGDVTRFRTRAESAAGLLPNIFPISTHTMVATATTPRSPAAATARALRGSFGAADPRGFFTVLDRERYRGEGPVAPPVHAVIADTADQRIADFQHIGKVG